MRNIRERQVALTPVQCRGIRNQHQQQTDPPESLQRSVQCFDQRLYAASAAVFSTAASKNPEQQVFLLDAVHASQMGLAQRGKIR